MSIPQMPTGIEWDLWNERIDNLWQNIVANTTAAPSPIKAQSLPAGTERAKALTALQRAINRAAPIAASVRAARIVRRRDSSPRMIRRQSERDA